MVSTMSDDLKRAATNLRSEGWDDEAAAVDATADEIERLKARIEELEAAFRRISHAPHGKVFNAHGHEEAYLIALNALGEKKDGN